MRHRGWLALSIMGFLIAAFTQKEAKTGSRSMDRETAMQLAEEMNTSFKRNEPLRAYPNGDFAVVNNGLYIFYTAKESILSIEGEVDHNAEIIAKDPDFFEDYKKAERREPFTLGEGYFYIEHHPIDGDQPQLVLRKDFRDGSISRRQFYKEARWLQEWAGWWRMVRVSEIWGKSDEELMADLPRVKAWAQKYKPRPW